MKSILTDQQGKPNFINKRSQRKKPNVKKYETKIKRTYLHRKIRNNGQKKNLLDKAIKRQQTATKTTAKNPQNSAKLNESSLISNLLTDDDILPAINNREDYEEYKELQEENSDPPNEIDVEQFDSVPYDPSTMDYKDGRIIFVFTYYYNVQKTC